jgi:hypothetical protein
MSTLVRTLSKGIFSLILRKFFAKGCDYFGRQLKFLKICIKTREKFWQGKIMT